MSETSYLSTRYKALDLAAWCGGRWQGAHSDFMGGFSIDTRSLRADDIFVALEGEDRDGHTFVESAAACGAGAALVSEAYAVTYRGTLPLLAVASPRGALAQIAAHYRRSMDAKIVGVTGSVGKTTVKEMVAELLTLAAPTARTLGNWNNDLGLPLSVLKLSHQHHYGVFECGINHPGEMLILSQVLQPTYGVMTKIGPAHIAHFDSVDAIAREKALLFAALPPDGTAFMSCDDPYFQIVFEQALCPLVTTSMTGSDADYLATLVDDHSCSFTVTEKGTGERVDLRLSQNGSFLIENALLAVAVARQEQIPWEQIAEALQAYQPLPMRWQSVILNGIEFINDAYNANPVSMRAAVESFASLRAPGKKWLVLGTMSELGIREEPEHEAAGALAASQPCAGLIAVGRGKEWIAEGAKRAGFPSPKIWCCKDYREAKKILLEVTHEGDAVLLKASRSEKLDEIIAG